MKRILWLTLLALALSAVLAGTAAAQDPAPTDDEVNAIARELYCPVCENTPLDVCPTLACQQWRQIIREKLAEGWTEQEIKQYFVDYYGARVLAEPPRQGFFWLIYIVPPVVILAGAFILARSLRSWKRPAAPAPAASPPPVDDEYLSRLEEELRKQD
jgi:cytochrome c-type biogenesis protein CcmH